MNTLAKKIIAAAIATSQFTALAATKVERKDVITHLDTQLREFRQFYRDEQRWIAQILVPLTSELVKNKKLLETYQDEITAWGSVEKIQSDLPIIVQVRAQRMLTDLDDAYLWLYLTNLNLNQASKKHLDLLQEIYASVAYVGAVFVKVQSQLKIILTIYANAGSAAGNINGFEKARELIANLKRGLEPFNEKRYESEVAQIENLLKEAKTYSSRSLWLDAVAVHQRIINDKGLAKIDPVRNWLLLGTIADAEVTTQTAKAALFERFQKIKLDDSEAAQSIRDYFNRFMLDPYPDRARFQRAEELLLDAERRFAWENAVKPTEPPPRLKSARTSITSARSKIRLCANSPPEGEHKNSQASTRIKVYNEHQFFNGKVVELIHIEAFSTDSAGHTKTSSGVVKGDSKAAEKIRERLGIKPGGKFEVTRVQTDVTGIQQYGNPTSEFGKITDGGPLPQMQSPTPAEIVQTKVQSRQTSDARISDISLGRPMTPGGYNVDLRNLYSQKAAVDRADMHNGSTDFSAKTGAFDNELKIKSEDVALEIRSGEAALQAAFDGVMSNLRARMRDIKISLPESTAQADGKSNSENLKHTIASTRQVVVLLRQKLNLGNHPQKQIVKQGLATVDKLLNSADIAIDAGSTESGQFLIEQAQSVLAAYGPMALRVAIAFTPANEVMNLVELVSGKDIITGKDIGPSGRILAGFSLIVGNRALWAAAGKFIKAGSASGEVEAAIDAANKISKDTDFYIAPSGQAIPSKAYRFIKEGDPLVDIDKLVKTGTHPALPGNGSYFTFDNLESITDAENNLQLPKSPRYKVEFDTKSVLDDVKIPESKEIGTNEMRPEPIVNANPQAGTGGGTQATTNKAFAVKRVTDLKTGKILYEQ